MSEELIKKSDAIKVVRHITFECIDADTRQKLIEAMPTIEPKRGEWIIPDDDESIAITGRCSACGWESHLLEDDVVGMPYCPNCGADMRGKDNE